VSLQVHCGHHGPSNGQRFNIVSSSSVVMTFRFAIVANNPHWSSFSVIVRRLQIASLSRSVDARMLVTKQLRCNCFTGRSSNSIEDICGLVEDRCRPLNEDPCFAVIVQRCNQCRGAPARHTNLIVVRLDLTAATGYSGALAPGPLAFASGMILFNDQGVNQVLGVEPDGVRS